MTTCNYLQTSPRLLNSLRTSIIGPSLSRYKPGGGGGGGVVAPILLRRIPTYQNYCTNTTTSFFTTKLVPWHANPGITNAATFALLVAGARYSSTTPHTTPSNIDKPHVVVLGTGWAAIHFIRTIDVSKYDVSIISPRNYFTFTPLLPSVCSGTLSPLACIEPVRTFTRIKGQVLMDFFEASCQDVDLTNKQVECSNMHGSRFKLNYDYLVMAVGAESNTFGIKGVKEYAHFLKEVEHAQSIRKHVMNNFEAAALPVTSPTERKRLLHFVVVGGGPTGVETAAEFADFIKEDMSKYFPELIRDVTVTLVEAQGKLLSMFSPKVSEFTAKSMAEKLHVKILLNHAVTEISEKTISLKNNTPTGGGEAMQMPYGFVLWASGVGQVPLSKRVIELVPEQKGNRILKVDEKLRVLGGDGLYAMGDCSWLEPCPLKENASELYTQALSSSLGPSTAWLASKAAELQKYYPQLSSLKWNLSRKTSQRFSEEGFAKYLGEIDGSFRPPAPTAQNATQAGKYLGAVFNNHTTPEQKAEAHAFVEKWSGSLAYIGGSRAVGSSLWTDMLGEFYSLPFWKMVYTQMQLTWRSRTICLFDWMRTMCAGRDVGRDHNYY